MVERSDQIVLDYIISSNKGEVLKTDGRVHETASVLRSGILLVHT